MQDQVIPFAVITFSSIICIAVAQLIFSGGLDPIKLLTLGAMVAALALLALTLKTALERPVRPEYRSAPRHKGASPLQPPAER